MTLSKAAMAARNAAKTNKQEYPIIGSILWWTINALELSQAELEKITAETIGASFMKDVPGKRRALRTALSAIETSGLIRRIRDDEDVIAYTLHEEVIDKKAIDMELKKEQVIVYDKKADKLDVRMTYKKDEIIQLFAKYQTIFTESDIRGMVLRYIKTNNGVTMRDSGGIYFVPLQATRDALKAFITAIKGKFYSLGVPDAAPDKTIMHEVIKEELDRELQLAAEDLKALLAKTTDRTKADSFETRMERFKSLRAKTELYKGLLANDIEDLTVTINELNEEVTTALMGEMKGHPQSKEFPYQARVEYSGKAKEKYGDTGFIVGYGSMNNHNAKVLFDKTNVVKTIAIEFLKVTVK